MQPALSPFPPSFDGNPWTYGFALFSLTLVSAMSLAQLLNYLFEAQRKREISQLVGNVLPPEPKPPMSSLTAFRTIVSSFLLMAFLGATPDVFILLAWGEASGETMLWLYMLDRVWDGLVVLPFGYALWMLERTRQALPQQLAKVIHVPLGPFRWEMAVNNLKIATMVFLIAVGVTLGKASV